MNANNLETTKFFIIIVKAVLHVLFTLFTKIATQETKQIIDNAFVSVLCREMDA